MKNRKCNLKRNKKKFVKTHRQTRTIVVAAVEEEEEVVKLNEKF